MRREPTFRLPVSPDDVVRHALAAYYRAVGEAVAPVGHPDPVCWADATSFLDTLSSFFDLRLRCDAAAGGHPVESDPARLAEWSNSPLPRDMHFAQVDPVEWEAISGAGQSPAVMAHGCAAVVAVGPASSADQDRAIPPSDDPLFACPLGQELPAVAAANIHEAA